MEDVRAGIEHLEQERWLLERTKHNVHLWNHLVRLRSHMQHIVVGFRYLPRVGEPHADLHTGMAFRYNGGPVGALSSYDCVVPEVQLRAIIPGSEHTGEMPYFSGKMHIEARVLAIEMLEIAAELWDLRKMLKDSVDYAPGGAEHRRLVRKYAQRGMTRYHLRPS